MQLGLEAKIKVVSKLDELLKFSLFAT